MKRVPRLAKFAGAVALLGAMLSAYSATTDLATAPLITSPTSSVLPNVFLMMDDSLSMSWNYMPDNAGNFGSGTYGAASSHCNGVFYDPTITYSPPVDSTGTSYSDSTFTAAPDDGYKASSTPTDLSTSFVPTKGTAEPAYYYVYTGTQTTEKQKDYYDTSSTFYTECNTPALSATIKVSGNRSTIVNSVTVRGTTITSGSTNASSSSSTVASNLASAINGLGSYTATRSGSVVTITGTLADVGFSPVVTDNGGGMTFTVTPFSAGPFTKVVVSATSGPGGTDERVNFANWWSYYRTRMLMMKTAAGRAFNSIGSTFRVGFATINNNNGTDVLALNTFDATQRKNWYAKLYAATPNNFTPLREALSDVGRMYAHKLPSTNINSGLTSSLPDPIQYSCQQNFTILTTDGFWRDPAKGNNATFDLSGNLVGNQDYVEPRPMYDGSNVSIITTTLYTTVQQTQTVQTGGSTTTTWGRKNVSIGTDCSVSSITVSNTASKMLTDNKRQVAVGTSTNNPNSSLCYNLSANAWLCRSSTSSGNPPVTNTSVTDSTGMTWSLVTSTTNNTGCVSDRTAFGTGYSSTMGACQSRTGFSGKYVNTVHQTKVDTTTNPSITSIDNWTATQQTTQTTTNGITGPVSALTPSTLNYAFTNNVSTTPSGTPTPTPGTWTNDTAPSQVCTKSSSLPSASTTADNPPSTTMTTSGTTTTTVLSTVGPTAGTPTTSTSPGVGNSDTLADVAEYYYITDLRTTALGNDKSANPDTAVNGTDVSENNVPSSGLDTAAHQHMTTFTLGLGARGRMVYDPAYENETQATVAAGGTRDFYDVRKGSTVGSSICPWQTTGYCDWPTPGDNQIENIDDLWHAAVNGRGTYFSAANPAALATALSDALAGVSARTGSAAAATTSNAFVTQGDNFLFRSTFVSQQWTGELLRQQLNVTTGAVLPTIDWSAQAKLDANAARKIYFFDSGAANKLSLFTLANLTTAGLSGNFDATHIAGLSQLCTVGATCLTKWAANTGYAVGNVYKSGTVWYHVDTAYTSGSTFGATDTANSSVISGPEGLNLVAFIKGDRSREGPDTDTNTGKYYRLRNHVLGDIVSSESNYVRGALAPAYADPGFSAYQTAMADRQAMVYVGANDGMLHAFYAADGMMSSTTGHIVTSGGVNVTGGDEAWGFIPTAVIPNLYKLADKNYENLHQYYVDGSPVTADICPTAPASACAASQWKTILVGGLNAGGTSYYALDITNPAQPKALWEFTDANMGLTFGNPKVVKLKTGQWVVLFTSGYNNTSGDGQGYLYVVDAYTGALVTSINGTGIIGTGVGTAATPSGLGKLDAPLAIPGVDATAQAVYAGDMQGNLWRFDINGDLGAAGYDAQLLATLRGPSGNVQPITTKPLLSLVGTTLVVYVGTGRYLGSSDLVDTSQQSFYALKDTYPTGTTPSAAIYGNPRTQGGFVRQTQTLTSCPIGSSANICTSGQTVVVSSSTPVDWGSKNGWFFDFPLAGERVNVDPAVIDATLVLNTNVPNASSCSVGGDSYQYQMDYRTGGAVASSPTGVVGTKIGNEISTRPVVATLQNGSASDGGGGGGCNGGNSRTNVAYSQGSGGNTPTYRAVWKNGCGEDSMTLPANPSRKAWRQLIQR